MSWYKAGTVQVTTGSAAVLGTGTQWVSKLKIGEVFYAPDGKLYEIESVSSDTTLTLTLPYAGDSNPAGTYVVIPTQGYLRSLASNVADLIALYQAVPDNVEHAEAAATNAAASAAVAVDKATQAETARGFAVFAQAAAEAARGVAESSAATASTKASEASASATAAHASETAAATSQASASTDAATAVTKASAASASASTASTAATTATTKAGEASTSASDALASKNSASASASTATTKAGEAATSATNAASSAATATAKAAEASASATAANQSKVDAQAIKDSMTEAAVLSVSGKTGVVTLTKSDVGLSNVDNLSRAQILASPTITGTPQGITKAHVGLANVDDTPDTSKPVSTAQAAAILAAVPVGTPMMWVTSTPPAGWLKRNGAAVSRTTYSALFAVIGTTFGAGNGSTTFNLPDDRGLVERGWDDGRGYDPSRVFGSEQGDAIRNISGGLAFHGSGTATALQLANGAFVPGVGRGSYNAGTTYSGSVSYDGATFDASTQVPTAGENRVKNRAYLPIIKY